jgi:hypothetical protein
MKPSASAARAAATISSRVASGRPNAMLPATVSENRKLSSITRPMADRSESCVRSRTSCPPTRSVPPLTS